MLKSVSAWISCIFNVLNSLPNRFSCVAPDFIIQRSTQRHNIRDNRYWCFNHYAYSCFK